MKKHALFVAILALAFVLGIQPCTAFDEMVTDMTKQDIHVGVRFSGERIYFFGTVPDPEAEVVVKLIPLEAHPIKLTRKGKVVLFWMATKKFEIENMPHIYKVHSSKPLSEILTPALARQLRIGYEDLKKDMELKILTGTPAPDDKDVMFNGFIKMKERENLYRVAENRIRINHGRLFEHYFVFPDKAKEGKYRIESYAVKNGKVIGQAKDIIEVKKVGLIAWLYRTSRHHGVLYGIMAVVIALGAGLLVGTLFKGGGGH